MKGNWNIGKRIQNILERKKNKQIQTNKQTNNQKRPSSVFAVQQQTQGIWPQALSELSFKSDDIGEQMMGFKRSLFTRRWTN